MLIECWEQQQIIVSYRSLTLLKWHQKVYKLILPQKYPLQIYVTLLYLLLQKTGVYVDETEHFVHEIF